MSVGEGGENVGRGGEWNIYMLYVCVRRAL